MKKIWGIFLTILLTAVGFILFFVSSSSIEEYQQAQYSLDPTYYTKDEEFKLCKGLVYSYFE